MNQTEKNTYVKPTIEDLGSLASMTQSGALANFDDGAHPAVPKDPSTS